MKKNGHPYPPIKHIDLTNSMTLNQLVLQFGRSGVMSAGKIARAVDTAQKMFQDSECRVFLGVAGAMVPGGMKHVLLDLLKTGKIHVLVTTGAMLTHDLVEALGHCHMKGTSHIDDRELHKQNLVRMYDSFMSSSVYEHMEEFLAPHFEELSQQPTIKDFLWRLGEKIPIHQSILRLCSERKIPLFCPALADSGIGLMVWGQLARGKKCSIPAFDDLKEILQLAWNAKKCGVWYIGGGVPKNFIQQAMQFAPKGASYGIQITTDRPEWGGSSGAELREGISWGKMVYDANHVDVPLDATVALPLIVGALKERLWGKEQPKSESVK